MTKLLAALLVPAVCFAAACSATAASPETVTVLQPTTVTVTETAPTVATSSAAAVSTPATTEQAASVDTPTEPHLLSDKTAPNGTYIVGEDLKPGTWECADPEKLIYWEATGVVGEVRENGLNATALISKDSKGATLRGCATEWVYAGKITPTKTSKPKPEPAPTTSWVPDGFMNLGGDVAMRWMDIGEYTCKSYVDYCFGVAVKTRDGCPSGIYIELALLDDSGAVVDKTNEITAGLAPGDIAKVSLGTSNSAVKQARVAQMNCLGR